MIDTLACCNYYNIEYSFITSLQQHGLLDITTIQETAFIPAHELQKLEKLIRLHYEMDINLEGIETVSYLLEKVAHLQDEMMHLKNRLRVYGEG